MVEVIVAEKTHLAPNVRMEMRPYKVPKDKHFPDGLKFAVQCLVKSEDRWISTLRVDNYPHDKRKRGAHVHKLESAVTFREMTFEEAQRYVENYAQRWMEW